jgi:TPR repeat protein
MYARERKQSVQGAQGLIGIQGYQGDIGIQGIQGIQGIIGIQGIQGSQGIIKKDMKEEIKLYRQSADLGNASAMVNLAMCYQKGDCVEKDMKKAITLYKKSADLGNTKAMFNLAICYGEGDGVDKNIKIAIQYYIEVYKITSDLPNFFVLNDLLAEYEGDLDVEYFKENDDDDDDDHCAVCYLSGASVRKAIYKCHCKPSKKICCGCYLKVISDKNECPCCKKENI